MVKAARELEDVSIGEPPGVDLTQQRLDIPRESDTDAGLIGDPVLGSVLLRDVHSSIVLDPAGVVLD